MGEIRTSRVGNFSLEDFSTDAIMACEVRSMGKQLVTNLEEGCKESTWKIPLGLQVPPEKVFGPSWHPPQAPYLRRQDKFAVWCIKLARLHK